MELLEGDYVIKITKDEAYSLGWMIARDMARAIAEHYKNHGRDVFESQVKHQLSMMHLLFEISGCSDLGTEKEREFLSTWEPDNA